MFPIPPNLHPKMITEDTPSLPHLVKAFEDTFNQINVTLSLTTFCQTTLALKK